MMVHPAILDHGIFIQSLPGLIQYSVFSPEKSFTGMTFLGVLGVVDRLTGMIRTNMGDKPLKIDLNMNMMDL